jgi:trehalose 6-phosphate phosphatase
MRALLARENFDVLAQLAFSRVLLAFDYDGTLAPIVSRPEKAQMRRRTAAMLQRACERYPCAVISGRSRRDLARRLEPVRVTYLLGNQGLELGAQTEEFERQVRQAIAPLQRALRDVQGAEIEDKTLSIAIHYRRSRRKRDARAALARAASQLQPPMRMIAGKLVVNLVPADAPNKGDALQAVRSRAGADTALYVGDDVSDEDVFSLDQPGRLLGVRVGPSPRSAAPYYLRNQGEIDQLLCTLIDLRSELLQSAANRRRTVTPY